MRSTRLFSRIPVAAVLAVTLLAPPAALATRPDAQQAVLPAIGIDNFGIVSDAYYRGAQPKGRPAFERLASFGVKTVIDLQGDYAGQMYARTEEADVRAAGMKFHRIPMSTRTAPTPEQLAAFLAIVNDPANQPVYVHCKGGRHRTGVMTAVFRMTEENWTADQAYQEMKRYDFGPSFLHPEFKDFVYDYHEQLSNSRSAARTPASRR